MTTINENHHPAVQDRVKNPDEVPLDASYLSTAQTPVAPPPPYSALSPAYSHGMMAPHLAGQPMQPCVYPSCSIFITQNHHPYQDILVPGTFLVPRTVHIRDYFAWSIINIFLGGLILGLPGILCSVMTRARKHDNDVEGATTLSRITLAINIVVTIIFFVLTAFLIIYYVAITSALTTE